MILLIKFSGIKPDDRSHALNTERERYRQEDTATCGCPGNRFKKKSSSSVTSKIHPEKKGKTEGVKETNKK